jgi:hypothetical protein
MEPPQDEHPEVRADPAGVVARTATAMAEALGRTADLPIPAAAGLRAACEGVSQKLHDNRVTLALVGDAGAGRRALINALLGDRVLSTSTPRRGSTVTIVRSSVGVDFSAKSLDGRSVAQLSRKVPDRSALFDKSLAQLDREAESKEQLAARLEAARQHVAELEVAQHPDARGDVPGDDASGEVNTEQKVALALAPAGPAPRPLLRGAAHFWTALWSWIFALFVRLSSRLRLSKSASEEDPEERARREERAARVAELEEHRALKLGLEREYAGARSDEQIGAHRERLCQERQKYEDERRVVFFSQVHDFDGTDIAERILGYPAKHLPRDVTLMDLPCASPGRSAVTQQMRNRVSHEVDALVVVADVEKPPGGETARLVNDLVELVPLALVVLTIQEGRQPSADRDGAASSWIEPRGRDAFERIVTVLGGNASRTPSFVVAAEAVLDARPESSSRADHGRATLGALSAWLDAERPALIARREAMRIRAGIADVLRDQEREEKSCRNRLMRLESNRIPHPDEFRGRLLKRVESAIEKGTEDVLAAGTQRLHDDIEGLRSEWKTRIASCAARSEVDACVAAINESAAARIGEKLEQTADLVASELHNVTETLETWAIEEIHTHYRLVRRLGAEALAPVASELTGEDLGPELLTVQPFEGAVDAFEKGRVGYGLGGVAAGAVLGSLILPGIGTAVGAVLGVFAGLLKGTDALKQECIARIDACLNDSERHALEQLQAKRVDLSRIIRVSLDEALDEALRRLGDAIERLMATERKAIDAETAKLERLTDQRDALEEWDRRLTKVVDAPSAADVPLEMAISPTSNVVRAFKS